MAIAACTPSSGTARGVVIGVEGSLTEVTAFTLVVEGEEIRYLVVVDGDYAFPLPHLRDHQRTGHPVLITWEIVADVHYALTVTDG